MRGSRSSQTTAHRDKAIEASRLKLATIGNLREALAFDPTGGQQGQHGIRVLPLSTQQPPDLTNGSLELCHAI
jgi:hypothetical protein